jgi:hypothetical protein
MGPKTSSRQGSGYTVCWVKEIDPMYNINDF